jgi:hypothetical protein
MKVFGGAVTRKSKPESGSPQGSGFPKMARVTFQ